MKTKAKGARIERLARDVLIWQGNYVIKAGGSLGIFDIVAIPRKLGQTRLIQVKSNRMASPAERAAIADCAVPPYCSKEIWVKKDRKPFVVTIIK